MSKDPVNPEHYKNVYGRQVIDIIRWLPFSIGNAIKYSFRNENKNNAIEDLKKALWYLEDFKDNPCSNSEDHHITSQLIDEVLTGIGEWENKTCRDLIKVYNLGKVSYMTTEKLAKRDIFIDTKAAIQQRIIEIQKKNEIV